jgi:uncharacterized protein (DUF433 family)
MNQNNHDKYRCNECNSDIDISVETIVSELHRQNHNLEAIVKDLPELIEVLTEIKTLLKGLQDAANYYVSLIDEQRYKERYIY